VKSLVDNIVTPVISKATSSVNFSELAVKFPNPADPSQTLVAISYGKFLNSAIAFVIIAFCLFLVIKLMNALNRKSVDAPPPPAPPTKEQELLTEIRDLLRTQRS
jgi:large conductance mechanosensitive channel